MRRFAAFSLVTVILLFCTVAEAKQVSVLFLGNSYTYLPGLGDEASPALPKMIQLIAKSIDPDLQLDYSFHTPGGYSFEMHFNDPASTKLLSARYDHVILQGQSIESLELTPWWEQQGNPGVKSFAVYLPKVLELALKANASVTLYVNWAWNPKNTLLKEDQPGLRFPTGTPRAGQKWCGRDRFEYQRMIDESFLHHSAGYPVEYAWIGDAWLALQTQGVASLDEFYIPDDWSHASSLGAFVTALVFARDTFHLDILKNRYAPKGMDPQRALDIAIALSQK
jgi:hypothetical protein